MPTEDFEYPEFDPDKKFPKFPKLAYHDYRIIKIKNTNDVCSFELWNITTRELVGKFRFISMAKFVMVACLGAERKLYNKWKHNEIKRREVSRYVYYRNL